MSNQMNNIKISAVIPVYNVSQYLNQCIDCVLSQSLKEFEVILVDDGSTDGSSKLCDIIANNDRRIRVIHKENEGSGPTRTRGLLEAKGEYIVFHDADDYFKPNMYEQLYLLAKANDADLVISSATVVGHEKRTGKTIERIMHCKEISFKSIQECRNGIMELFPTSTIFDVPWNKLYRREVAVKNGIIFKPLRRCQDAVWNLDFYNHCTKVVSTSKSYYYYRENTQESTWRKFPKEYIDIQVFYFTHLREILTSWGKYKGWIKEHYDTSFILAIESCVNMFDNPIWRLSRLEKYEYVLSCVSRTEVRNFLPEASIRSDQINLYRLIQECDVKSLMLRHRIEFFKTKITRNRFVYAIWRLLKHLK